MSKFVTKEKADFKQIFEALPALFLVLKPDPPQFTIAGVSDAYLQATMTNRDEITGKGPSEIFPDNPEDGSATGTNNLRKSLEKVIAKKTFDVMTLQKYDIQRPVKDGGGFEERFWSPKNTPVINKENEVIYIIHQVEDITEFVKREQKRNEEVTLAAKEIKEKTLLIKENEDRITKIMNAILKYTVLDFSEKLPVTDKGDELDAIALGLNSLTEELEDHILKLASTNEELEYANKELDSFSYSVSHDLRAPLRAINGYSQILLEDYGGKFDEDGKAHLDVIIKSATRMGILIDDLLTFSRIGKQSLKKMELNMDDIVKSVIAEFIDLNKDHHIRFDIHPLNEVKGDNSMLRQVMSNLVSNALKYSGKKTKPSIEIGCFEKKDTVIYYVKDNGAGFDMKYYDKLFGVFQRLHDPNEFDGTGVGLALVQRIIKKHGGEVWAEGKPDEGATFYFSLPLN